MERSPERSSLGLGLLIGLIAGAVAFVTAEGRISVELFAVAAQVFPVFLVALAVEQRLADRLGTSEDQYVEDAGKAVELFVEAIISYENGDEEEALRLQNAARGRRETRWVESVAYDVYEGPPEEQFGFDDEARKRYRARRRSELSLVVGVILLLVVGELVALVGLISNGAGAHSAWFLITTWALVATFVVITLMAFRELLPPIEQ
jgi:hypothetical protein